MCGHRHFQQQHNSSSRLGINRVWLPRCFFCTTTYYYYYYIHIYAVSTDVHVCPPSCCLILSLGPLSFLLAATQVNDVVPVHRNLSWVYRFSAFAIWLFTTIIMVIDRFYWNVWPRQMFCTDGCGNDFFCDMDEVIGIVSWMSYNYNIGEGVLL